MQQVKPTNISSFQPFNICKKKKKKKKKEKEREGKKKNPKTKKTKQASNYQKFLYDSLVQHSDQTLRFSFGILEHSR
jgi:arginine decarboxylase-like protein